MTKVLGAGGVPDSFGIAVPGTWTRYDLAEDGSGSTHAEIRRGTADGPGGLDGLDAPGGLIGLIGLIGLDGMSRPGGTDGLSGLDGLGALDGRGRSGGAPGGPDGAGGAPGGAGGGRADEAVRDTRRILEGARRRGALYAAGTTPSDGKEPLTAGVMIFSLTPPPGKAASAHALARRFPAAGRRWARGGARTFSTETLPRVGPVRRLMGVEEGESADGAPYRLLVMHTLVPVPGSRRVIVVLCFSPDLPLIVRVHDLFDAVTATFSFGYGPPTANG
ncbi:hypothetical protein [Streptomyces uncialis]|uniref:hypothetical protein n=1 Tax=Streptomyces uncialis TaxID=1048205 RepID=UPI0033CF7169